MWQRCCSSDSDVTPLLFRGRTPTQALAASGVTIFLTTQDLEEADRLAGRIAVLDGGRVIAEGTAGELKRRVAARRLDLTCVDPAAFATVSACLGGHAVHRDAASLTAGVPTDGSAAGIRALLDEADPGRALIASFAVRDVTLDDAFLTLTQNALAWCGGILVVSVALSAWLFRRRTG
jgi:ABC-2 type transport system ATP-binding protein